jgi:hypothetical protein
MPDRRKFAQMAVAGLLAVVGFAPAASAQPMTHDTVVTSKAYAPSSAAMDMHASTVHAAAATQQDLRTENAVDPGPAPAPPAGLPVFETYTDPIASPKPQPVAADDGGIDVDWPIAMIALFGAFAIGGGIVFAARRTRTQIPAH